MQLDWLKKCGVVPHPILTSIPTHGFRHTRSLLNVELRGLGFSVFSAGLHKKHLHVCSYIGIKCALDLLAAQGTRAQQFWMLNKIRGIRS